jgi:acyl carrier protein
MLPSAFVLLPALPLQPNGKLDRAALPPTAPTAGADSSYVMNSVEQTIATLWCDLLELEHVGLHDNFFDLGGHSLLATQLLARIRDIFQVDIPLRSLFEAPTVAAISQEISRRRQQTSRQFPLPLVRASRVPSLPVTAAQQRLWLLDRSMADAASFNVVVAARLLGALDPPSMKQALTELVKRHEALRTTFPVVDGTIVQRIWQPPECELEITDLRQLPNDRRKTAIRKLHAVEAARSFDLTKEFPMRFQLVHVADAEHVLLLTIHHIIADAWSISVFADDLAVLYGSLTTGRPSALQELRIQFADFAFSQRSWLQTGLLTEQLEYWKRQLGGPLPRMVFPGERPNTALRTHAYATMVRRLGFDSRLRVEGTRSAGATAFMVLLAALNATLYRCTGCDDVLVGTDVANRNQVATEHIIGFFVNTLVLRTNLAGDPTLAELLARVRQVVLDGYERQDVPFDVVARELQTDPDFVLSRLFRVLLVLQNTPVTTTSIGDLAVQPIELRRRTRKRQILASSIDLVVQVEELGSRADVHWRYNTDTFEESTITRIVTTFQHTLRAFVSDPQQRLSNLREY